jgi:hypothetical protein
MSKTNATKCKRCKRPLPPYSGRGPHRTYCSRACRESTPTTQRPIACRQCDAPLPVRTGRGRPASFCCPDHRVTWWSARQGQTNTDDYAAVMVALSAPPGFVGR